MYRALVFCGRGVFAARAVRRTVNTLIDENILRDVDGERVGWHAARFCAAWTGTCAWCCGVVQGVSGRCDPSRVINGLMQSKTLLGMCTFSCWMCAVVSQEQEIVQAIAQDRTSLNQHNLHTPVV